MITRKQIYALGLCREAREWMKANPRKSVRWLWDNCPRGSWLLWMLEKLNALANEDAARISCRIVRETPVGDGRTVWDLLTDERSRNAVITTEAWLRGEAALVDVERAANAAYAAYTYAAVANSDDTEAAYAAYVAAYVAINIVNAAYAYVVVSDSDSAEAASTAASAAPVITRVKARQVQADIVRQEISFDTICERIAR